MPIHVFQNTITNLPYGYQIRIDVISYTVSGASTVTTTTVTNGSYITRVGRVTKSVDYPVGDVRLGDWSFTVRDIGGEVSTNWSPFTRDMIEARYWISYDAGTTWECLFFGFVRLEQLKRSDRHLTNTYNQTWEFSAYHAFDPLKTSDILIFSGTLAEVTVASLPEYHTTEAGAPVQVNTRTVKMTSLTEALSHVISKVPFVPTWTGAPASTTLDYASSQCLGYNANTTTGYPINQLYLLNDAPPLIGTAISDKGFFGTNGGPGSVYSYKNYAKMLSELCNSLNLIPIPRLVDTSGTVSFTTYLYPRFLTAPTAITTDPTPLIRRSVGAAPYADGGQVRLQGHPLLFDYYISGVNKGNQHTITVNFATSPDIGVDPYLWGDSVWQADGAGKMNQNRFASTQQLFAYTGSAMVQVHKFKHLTAQSYHETAGIGYYGAAESMTELLFDLSGSYAFLRNIRPSYTLTYKSLKGASIADIELLKGMTIDGSTYIIESISRDAFKNEMEITVSKVA